MELNDVLAFCTQLPFVKEKMPFGDGALLFTIGDKMFILIDLDGFSKINLKCDPEYAIELREMYEHVIPGYHMNKKHWNSILFPNNIPDKLIYQWIKDSYDIVYKSLPAKVRAEM